MTICMWSENITNLISYSKVAMNVLEQSLHTRLFVVNKFIWKIYYVITTKIYENKVILHT